MRAVLGEREAWAHDMEATSVKRWVAAIAVGGAVASSCDIDKRGVALDGVGRDAGPEGVGSVLGVGPRLEVTPPSVDLGWVTTGFAARARLTLRNTGDAPVPAPSIAWSTASDPDFVLIQNLCEAEIAPAESCEVRVQVVPSRAGALSGTLEVRGGTSSAEVGVAALGMLAGDLILAPATGSFEDYGGVLVGGVKESTFRLSNPGAMSTGPLQLGINRPEFALVAPEAGECVPGTTALEPGQSCDVRLAFSPTARGLVDATLTAASEAAGSVSLTLGGRGLVPGVLEASVSSIDFEGVLLTQSARRSVTLSNGGDEPLELSGVSLAPAEAPGFTIANGTCAASTSLAAGRSCDVEVEFRPPSAGAVLMAELVASHAGATRALSVPLRGVGLQPGSLLVAPVTAGEEDFGDVLVGESLERVFRVVNPGAQASGALEWTIGEGFEVSPPAEGDCTRGATSLVNGEECTLRVRFSPSRREATSGSLIITSPLAGAISLTLTGHGVVNGQLRAAPELSFGRVLTAASAERSLSVRNIGDQPLSPPSLKVSSADPAQGAAFTFQSECTEPLARDQECTVSLTFAPTSAVPHAAILLLESPPSAPASVLLLGEALVPGSLVLAPAEGSSTEFGDVAVGASLSRSFTLTNPGAVSSGPLTISTDDNQFGVELGACAAGELIDGSRCTFSIVFTPTAPLAAAANVSVQSPGAGRAGIELSGRGRSKAALAATGNRDMGRSNIGQAAPTVPENEFTWTVNNTGDLAAGALVVTNDNAQEFAVTADGCAGIELAGQTSCTMNIRFLPAATGQRSGRITVSDPSGMSAAPLALTGLGVQLAGPGEPCINAECRTGECTPSGVCCDTACDRACEVCSAAGVCTPLSAREPCGNGAACLGVDQCRLPEGAPCTAQGGDAQCGSGFCQPRFGGGGDADRVCCREVCGAGLACDAQGQCQQLTAGDGAPCGRPEDLPCGANLTCTPCVGSGTGQSQCKPAGVCCGSCGPGLECVNGNSCGCPIGPNGLRGLPCAAGCAVNQDDACCPEAPDCDPGLRCDAFDNLCKECLGETDCTNARPGSDPTCTDGVCSYPCAGQNKECDGACIRLEQCCTPDDCDGRACNDGVCAPAAGCQADESRCNAGVRESCVNGAFAPNACPTGETCVGQGQCQAPAPVPEDGALPERGAFCSADGQCAEGLTCVDGVCCERACGECEACTLGSGQCTPTSSQCFTQGASIADGVCRDVLNTGTPLCEVVEVNCNGVDCPISETCCVGNGGFACQPTSNACNPAGLVLQCDEDIDCVIGSVCCFDRTAGVVQCRPEGQCEVDGTQQLPNVSPLCQSPRGQTFDCGSRQCEPIPNAPAGWSSCARPL